MINNDLKVDIVLMALRPRLQEDLENYTSYSAWREHRKITSKLFVKLMTSVKHEEIMSISWEKIFDLMDLVGFGLKLNVVDKGRPTIYVMKLCNDELERRIEC